jgi:alkylated DNA repair dioxygenase AlkB
MGFYKVNVAYSANDMFIDLPKDLDIQIFKSFYTTEDSDSFFKKLLSETEFETRDIMLFGKTYKQPRLISWCGDPDAVYSYSGDKHTPKPWTRTLKLNKVDLEKHLKCKFNSVLLNLYNDNSHSMGLHSDDEKKLGQKPIIASLSFGETRAFRFVHKKTKEAFKFNLSHGDLLVMKGKTQELYKHELPKSKKILKPRLNLTFRFVYSKESTKL